jgi:hypothetical protein
MTDNTIDAIPAAMFEALRNLLAVCADPKRSSQLLTDLEARVKAAKQAEHRAATQRDRASVESAREAASLDERREQLAAKSRDLTSREAQVAQREKQVERVVQRDPNIFGTLTRESHNGG